MIKKNNKICGLTLIELLLTVVLIGVLVLALASIQKFAFHHVIASERRAKLQNEGYLILETITKSLLNSTSGDITNPAIKTYTSPYVGIAIRVDRNAPVTPQDYSDDTIIGYRRGIGPNTNVIRYCDNLGNSFPADLSVTCSSGGGWPIIEDKVSGFTVTATDNNTTVLIDLALRHNASNTLVNEDNPEVNMSTQVHMQSSSGN